MSYANTPLRHLRQAKMKRQHDGWAHGHVRMLDIRSGDTVEVIGGRDKGKRGVVDRVLVDEQRIVVQGVNIQKRHVKAQTQGNLQGGIIDFTAPIAYSNVQLVCKHCDKPTRIGHTILENGVRAIECKKCGQPYERTGMA